MNLLPWISLRKYFHRQMYLVQQREKETTCLSWEQTLKMHTRTWNLRLCSWSCSTVCQEDVSWNWTWGYNRMIIYWSLDMEWSWMEASGEESLPVLSWLEGDFTRWWLFRWWLFWLAFEVEDEATDSARSGSSSTSSIWSSSSSSSTEAVVWLYSPWAMRWRAKGFLCPVVFLILALLFWNQILIWDSFNLRSRAKSCLLFSVRYLYRQSDKRKKVVC